MSCRRARRELLWFVRFGELDADSAPSLEHLAGCQACRDEVGLDRALVRQLRVALAERVGDATPSPDAWAGILARMRAPEPPAAGLRPWTRRVVAGLRAGTAMAGASLALVLALQLEVVPFAPSLQPEPERSSPPPWAGGIPPFVDDAPTIIVEAEEPEPDPEPQVASVGVRPAPELEQLPPARSGDSQEVEPHPDEDASAPAEDRSDVAPGWEAITVRLVPADAARIAAADAEEPPDDNDVDPAPTPLAQGPS